MHTLVIDENKTLRDQVAGYLQNAKHRVDVAADRAAALRFLESESPEAVVVGWGQTAIEVLRRVRSCEDSRHTFVVALTENLTPSSIASLYTAGVDDFLRRPVVREELLARIETPLRIAKWKAQPKTAAIDLSEDLDLRKLKAFKNLGPVVGEDLSQLFGELDVVEGWSMAGELRGASIPMSVASEQAEIRVSVVVEAALLRTLAGVLLGDENAPPAALEDMLREIVNTAGGAVKRAAAAERVVVTTGLPVNNARGATRNELTLCWTARICGSNAKFGIIGEIHKSRNQRVAAAKLQEGMVLTQDIRNESGALVMPSGTRLTATAVTRLTSILGNRFVVDVTAPAA